MTKNTVLLCPNEKYRYLYKGIAADNVAYKTKGDETDNVIIYTRAKAKI